MNAPLSFRESFALLLARDFRRLFLARGVSAFGSSMMYIALPFGVLEVAGSEQPQMVGFVVASATMAQLCVQLFAGALADRGSRKRIMVIADVLAATAQAVLAFFLISGLATVPIMMLLAAAIGICFALHWPAGFGLVPLVVAAPKLQAANALLALANNMAWGLGAAVGGFIAATWGAGYAIAIDAGTFALSALLIQGLRPRAQAHGDQTPGLLRGIVEGWQEFISHNWLWIIVLQFSLLVMGWNATYAVIGPIVADRLMAGAQDWGIISLGFGAGLVTGGLIAIRARVQRPMLVGALCILPLVLFPLSLIQPLTPLLPACAAFVGGLGIEIFSVFWSTTLHTRVAPEALSRVSAYDVVGSMLFAPVGEALAGLSVAAFGAPNSLAAAAVLILLPTLAVLATPAVRNLRAISTDLPGPTPGGDGPA